MMKVITAKNGAYELQIDGVSRLYGFTPESKKVLDSIVTAHKDNGLAQPYKAIFFFTADNRWKVIPAKGPAVFFYQQGTEDTTELVSKLKSLKVEEPKT